MFPPKEMRSEEVATGGALGGRRPPRLGVISIGGTLEDRGDKSEFVEVSPSVGPQEYDEANEVRCGLTGRLIASSFIKVSSDDELELWDPFLVPCADDGTTAVAGRIFLVRK